MFRALKYACVVMVVMQSHPVQARQSLRQEAQEAQAVNFLGTLFKGLIRAPGDVIRGTVNGFGGAFAKSATDIGNVLKDGPIRSAKNLAAKAIQRGSQALDFLKHHIAIPVRFVNFPQNGNNFNPNRNFNLNGNFRESAELTGGMNGDKEAPNQAPGTETKENKKPDSK